MPRHVKTAMHENQNKIARFIRLDQLLRTSKGCTIKELMNDECLDIVSERTLRANLQELRDNYGALFDEELSRGREKVWRYKDTNFSIMQQTSKDMEIIRQSLENLSLFKGDPRYDMLRFYLMGIEKGMDASGFHFMSFDNNNDVIGLEHMEIILDAIIHKHPLKMWYKPFNKNEFSCNIHPYHLRQYNRRWYVFAYSEEKKDILNFPLDRIRNLEHLSKPYIDTDIDFEEYFDDIVGVTNYKDVTVEKVILKISDKSIDYVRTKPFHWSQTELKDRRVDGYNYIQLRLKVNTEFKMLLFSYSDAIEVIEPAWLRDFFARKIRNMIKKYEV